MVEKEKANARELLDALTKMVRETFVATYEKEENALIMRLINGQRFAISVQEIT